MKSETKTFAFKLASQKAKSKDSKWTLREGLNAGICTWLGGYNLQIEGGLDSLVRLCPRPF